MLEEMKIVLRWFVDLCGVLFLGVVFLVALFFGKYHERLLDVGYWHYVAMLEREADVLEREADLMLREAEFKQKASK